MFEENYNLFKTLNSIGDGLIITDTAGKIISMNSISEKLTGWDKNEAKGQDIDSVFNIINAKTREKVESPVNKVLKNGKVVGLANHTILISKNGDEYQIADSGTPIKNNENETTGVALVFRNVTEKYRIRESLKQSEEKYRAIFENTGTATLIIEEDTTISLVNKKFEQLTGLSKSEVENKISWTQLIDAEHLKKMIKYHKQRRKSNVNVPNCYETKIFDKNGEPHHIFSTVDMIPNSTKSVASFLDITNLKKAKIKIEKQKKMLHKLNSKILKTQEEERRNISRDLHDDLGQHLTAISINLAAIKNNIKENDNPTTMERLEDSLKSVDVISKRIHDMVHELRPAILDDLGLIKTIKWYIKQFRRRTGISVSLNISDFKKRLDPELEIALYRIIQEALNNVAKHAEAGKVDITIIKDIHKLKILIKDNGKGFDSTLLNTNPLENSGMGIPGMRERLLGVNGKLKIDSKHGFGTKLIIIIPEGEIE